MPNHYTTHITITGPQDAIEEFKKQHIIVTQDEEQFDFNTIIPRPAIVTETESSSTVDCGLVILGEESGDPYLQYPWVKEAGITDVEALKEFLKQREPDAVAKAETALECKRQTGFLNWFDWSFVNWGTKWNSYGYDMKKDVPKKFVFCFDSAWGPPSPVLAKMIEMHPALTFKIKGRDEGERKWDQSLNDWISRGSDAIRGFFYVMHLSFDEPVVINDRANRRIVTVAEGKVTIRENVEWPDEESISEGTEALPIAQ